MRNIVRFGLVIGVAQALMACTHGSSQPVNAAHVDAAPRHDDAAVVRAASCWLGGLWSDALGEKTVAWSDTRNMGIAKRCNDDEGMRSIDGKSVEAVVSKLDNDAQKVLVRTIANAARENANARRAADRVKADSADDLSTRSTRRDDKLAAAPELRKADALVALFHDQGAYASDAHAIALLLALDRFEIARGLPKHLKIEALATPLHEVFGVNAPELPRDDAAPLRSGMWLAYLSSAASAAGHAIPTNAPADPRHREPLAWNGVLEGFSDKLRAAESHASAGELGRVVHAVTVRLDDQYRVERAVSMSYSKT